MDDGHGKLKIISDHFQAPTSSEESLENRTPSISEPGTDKSLRSHHHHHLWTRSKLRSAFMLKLFSLRGLSWGSRSGGQEKVELTTAEIESLRSEVADIEEREAHLKAQWTALPGEPPPIDDTDVDDWLPRFIVLHGACIFLYLSCTDLSPQDSTLLSDVVEVGRLPSIKREDDEVHYAFYILTHQGLRYECSSSSKIQIDSWLSALQTDCKLELDTSVPNGSVNK
ncbi:uncharacterized protein LOC129312165 isoform X2 [Prosopis cineraria]|uniref:uncharacterized protein LOC129312165 isoform X2 n=1 Tax=Prosopis cineraria TaxID=364024 RepID=UPI00240EE357|nr:uncharacterized protein LOC129312165 isoform X2 [Prosopis cineraria]